ncbi:hypothetical protein [Amycolatopsis sp. NPDC054798]
MADEWFEYCGDLSETERRFVEALRVRAAGWRECPLNSRVDPPDAELPLVASLDLTDPASRLVLLTVGVHLDGRTLRGDEVHNQLFTLPDEPTSLAFTATGDPDELAVRAANWFENLLRRPVVRYEWRHRRKVYAHADLFADTSDLLGSMYNRKLCPRGQLERLAATGHLRGRGWVDPRGLGKPDAVVRIR